MSTYNKTTWNNDAPPAWNATNLNKIEQGIADAHSELAASIDPTTGHKHTGAAGDGPQLTHDAIKTAAISAFRAYQSTAQSVSANTFTKIVFQSEEFDQLGEYDPATSTLTVSKSGLYVISAGVGIPSVPSGTRMILNLRISSVDRRIFDMSPGAAQDAGAVGCTISKLNAGDTVVVILYLSSSLNTSAGVDTFFTAVRVA